MAVFRFPGRDDQRKWNDMVALARFSTIVAASVHALVVIALVRVRRLHFHIGVDAYALGFDTRWTTACCVGLIMIDERAT